MNKQTILISGANGNIAVQLATRFAEEGHQLLLLTHEEWGRIAPLCSRFGSLVKIKSCDLQSVEETAVAIGQLLDEGFSPNAVIHTAATRATDHNSFIDSDLPQWLYTFDQNVKAAVNLLHTLLPLFREKRAGRVVLFGSDVTRIGLPNGSAYAAAKAALANLVKTLSYELGPYNVLINMISPGPVVVDNKGFSPDYIRFREEYYEKELARIPLGKLLTPDMLYPLCKFLTSEDNQYLTGEEIILNGGKR